MLHTGSWKGSTCKYFSARPMDGWKTFRKLKIAKRDVTHVVVPVSECNYCVGVVNVVHTEVWVIRIWVFI